MQDAAFLSSRRFGGIAGSFLVADLTARRMSLPDIFGVVAIAALIAMVALGILRLGAVYVPIDPASPEQRLSLMLEDSQPTLLLVDSHTQPHQLALAKARGIPTLDIEGIDHDDTDTLVGFDTVPCLSERPARPGPRGGPPPPPEGPSSSPAPRSSTRPAARMFP